MSNYIVKCPYCHAIKTVMRNTQVKCFTCGAVQCQEELSKAI